MLLHPLSFCICGTIVLCVECAAMQRIIFPIAILLVPFLSACASAVATPIPSPAPTANPLRGGVVATFELNDQEFRVWVTNPQTIQQLLDLRDGKSEAKIPNGKILRGAGQANYNAPWTRHLDPNEIEMADFTIEVCDAEPKYVQENVAEFVDVVGRYCPWSAALISLQDFR